MTKLKMTIPALIFKDGHSGYLPRNLFPSIHSSPGVTYAQHIINNGDEKYKMKGKSAEKPMQSWCSTEAGS